MLTIFLGLAKTYWKPILIGILVLVVIGGSIYIGYQYRAQKARIELLEKEKQTLQASNDALSQTLSSARNAQAARENAENRINAADQTYIQGVQDGKTQLDSAISQLHAHVSMLVKQHKTDQRAIAKLRSTDVSVSATGTRERDGDPESGFLVTHGDDALRLANEADDVVRQLGECQSYISSVREMKVNQNNSEKK